MKIVPRVFDQGCDFTSWSVDLLIKRSGSSKKIKNEKKRMLLPNLDPRSSSVRLTTEGPSSFKYIFKDNSMCNQSW